MVQASRKIQVLALAACVISLVNNSTAGTVEQATIHADLQMQVKDGQLHGCGFRLKGLTALTPQTKSVVVLDVSFNLYADAIGLMKGGALQIEVVSGAPGASKNRPVEKFWAKVSGQPPTAALNGKTFPAEDKGYLLYGLELTKTVDLFDAVFEGTPLMLGVQVTGEAVDRIYSGTVSVSDADKAQGRQCIAELLPIMKSKMQKALERSQAGGK